MSIEDQNARQRFLQCIMSRKVMTKESITEFLANIGCNQGYQDFLRQVNTDLEFFDLKIQAGNHPITGTTTLCLINCNSDEIAQLATDLTPSELQYFKKLVELIMVDGLYQISSTDALNSNSTITPTISKQIAENAIDKFIADQWLLEKYSCVIRDGFLSFGVRTAVELHLYLKDEFDPFTDCHACKTSVFNIVFDIQLVRNLRE
jgi:hypothetical protein